MQDSTKKNQVHSYKGKSPQITKPFFQAPGSQLVGDIEIGEKSECLVQCSSPC